MRFLNAHHPTLMNREQALNAQLSIQTGGRRTLATPEPAQGEGRLDFERLLAIHRN
jgi:hypothetical protein